MRIKYFVLAAVIIFSLSTISKSQENEETIILGTIHTISSRILGEERRVLVALPDNYESDTKGYPVLIKCDAMGKKHFIYRVSEIYESVSQHKIPEIILVSIENTDRNRDMYPQDDKRKDIVSGADNFHKFITDELIPYLDKKYRTLPFRILMGESNSAMFCIYSMLSYPGAFNSYIASSPELDYFGNYFLDLATIYASKSHRPKSKLFIIHGGKDNKRVLKSTPVFVAKLKELDIAELQFHYQLLKDEGHVPSTSMISGLEYTFSGYLAPNEIIKGGKKAIESYYDEFNKKLGIDLDIPSNSLLKYAMSLQAQKKTDEAEKILLRISRKYQTKDELLTPLMLLSRIYHQKGDVAAAEKCLRKVIEIWPQTKIIMEKRIERIKKAR